MATHRRIHPYATDLLLLLTKAWHAIYAESSFLNKDYVDSLQRNLRECLGTLVNAAGDNIRDELNALKNLKEFREFCREIVDDSLNVENCTVGDALNLVGR